MSESATGLDLNVNMVLASSPFPFVAIANDINFILERDRGDDCLFSADVLVYIQLCPVIRPRVNFDPRPKPWEHHEKGMVGRESSF